MLRTVLLVEDSVTFQAAARQALALDSIDCVVAGSLADARTALSRQWFDVVILDQGLPDGSGLDLLRELSQDGVAAALPQVLMVAGTGDVPAAVEAMRLGAFDYCVKQFTMVEFRMRVERAFERASLQRRVSASDLDTRNALRDGPDDGESACWPSASMRALESNLTRYAQAAPMPVLILGETGAGKDVTARRLHALSPRANAPLVAVNCASLDTNLFESELFGHEKGSFTGATGQKPGLIELANGGTLFLDELGEMPLPAQAKLLRTLETRSFRRVGGTREIFSDFWLVSATNRREEALRDSPTFRSDFFYRLSTLVVRLPPLRERLEDLPLLVGRVCRDVRGSRASDVRLAAGCLDAFARYAWPGNVRELRNVIERALVLSPDGILRPPEDIVSAAVGAGKRSGGNVETAPSEGGSYETAPYDTDQGSTQSSYAGMLPPLREWERRAQREAIRRALALHSGNKTAAARALSVSLSQFKRLLEKEAEGLS